MNPNYIGLIRKHDDSDFSVEFPDFPGCVRCLYYRWLPR